MWVKFNTYILLSILPKYLNSVIIIVYILSKKINAPLIIGEMRVDNYIDVGTTYTSIFVKYDCRFSLYIINLSGGTLKLVELSNLW